MGPARIAEAAPMNVEILPLSGQVGTVFDQATQKALAVPQQLGFSIANRQSTALPGGLELTLAYDSRVYDLMEIPLVLDGDGSRSDVVFGASSSDGVTVTQQLSFREPIDPAAGGLGVIVIVGQIKPLAYPYDILRQISEAKLDLSGPSIADVASEAPGQILDDTRTPQMPPAPTQTQQQVWGAELKPFWGVKSWDDENADYFPLKLLVSSVGPGVMPQNREIRIELDSRISVNLIVTQSILNNTTTGKHAEIISSKPVSSNRTVFTIQIMTGLKAGESLLIEFQHKLTHDVSLRDDVQSPLLAFVVSPADVSLRDTGSLFVSRRPLRAIALG